MICIVKRPFFLRGLQVFPGTEIELASPLAHELRAANKVEFASPVFDVEVENDLVIDADDPGPGLTAADVPGSSKKRHRGKSK